MTEWDLPPEGRAGEGSFSNDREEKSWENNPFKLLEMLTLTWQIYLGEIFHSLPMKGGETIA